MARTIVITSGKGGVGKTTITASLGRSLAKLGYKVVMLDVDLGLNNLDVLMNIENRIVFDLIDVIENRCRLKEALVMDSLDNNLFVLPSCHSYDKSQINGQNIKIVVNQLKNTFDYVLLDCPAGIELGFHRAVSVCDEAFVVITPHISSIRDADKVVKLLGSYNASNCQLIVNRARGDLIAASESLSVDDISALLNCPIVGVIPDSDEINQLSNLAAHLKDKSIGGQAMMQLAKNVVNKTNVLIDVSSAYRGFWGKLRTSIRKFI